MKKQLVIDQASMGSEWRGGADGLESFANCLRALNVPGWEILTCIDMYNGGGEIVFDDDGFPVEDPETFPQSEWLTALDQHAVAHPDLWA